MSLLTTIKTTLAAALAAATLTTSPTVADQPRTSQTVITAPDGRTFTRQETSTGRFGDRRGTVTWTGPDGNVTTRDYRRQWDRQNGFSRQSVTTGPRGRTSEVQERLGCRDGACARSVDRQGFGGRRTRIDGGFERVAPGVLGGRRSVTRDDGRTRTWNWRRVRD